VNTVSSLVKSDSFFFYKTHVPLARNDSDATMIRRPSEVFFIPYKTISFGLIHITAGWRRLPDNHLLEA